MRHRTPLFAVAVIAVLALPSTAADTTWMSNAKYGLFMHYQYRILLGYSIATKPQFPKPSEMTARQWNQFVDGFDVAGFARQAAEGKVGWVILCIDDHYFAWPCAPNATFDRFCGLEPGEKCARRDLIMELADALNPHGVKLICYFAGLNGYMKEPLVTAGLQDDGNPKTPPSAESRKRRIAILKEYADRYTTRVAGWWFDGLERDSYGRPPDDWHAIEAVVHTANPNAVIAFSFGSNEQACVCPGVDDFTAGDTWSRQDLTHLTPARLPPQNHIVWHGKIYCGSIYHGQGTSNQYTDQQLIDWIKTCNAQGGACTLDWPFDPKTGLIKEFGMRQLRHIASVVKREN